MRALLVLAVTFFIVAITYYSWFALPSPRPRPLRIYLFWVVMIPYPFFLNRVYGANRKMSGIRLDNVKASATEVAIWFGIAATFLAGIGFLVDGWHGEANRRLLERAGLYLLWGPIQQYLLCSFVLNRIRQAGLGKYAAAITAAVLFGFVHSPNWVLVGVTTFFGFVNCLLFMRIPNIFTLGIAHGLLGTLLYHAWPVSWTQKLTIGGAYVHRLMRHGGMEFP